MHDVSTDLIHEPIFAESAVAAIVADDEHGPTLQ